MMNFFKKNNISVKLMAILLVSVISVAVLIVYSLNTVAVFRINGPIYKEIMQSQAIVADTLPPSGNIMESYLIIRELATEKDKAKIEKKITYFNKLKKEYYASIDSWNNELVAGEMKTLFLDTSFKPADEFYKIVEKEYLPMLKAGNQKKAENLAYGVLTQKYNEHRSALESIALLSVENEKKAANEARIMEKNSVRNFEVAGAVILLFMLAASIILVLAVGKLGKKFNNFVINTHKTAAKTVAAAKKMQEYINATNAKLHCSVAQTREALLLLEKSSLCLGKLAENLTKTTIVTDTKEPSREAIKECMATIKNIEENEQELVINIEQLKVQMLRKHADIEIKHVKVVQDAKAAVAVSEITENLQGIFEQLSVISLSLAIEAARTENQIQEKNCMSIAKKTRKMAEESEIALDEVRKTLRNIENAVSELANCSNALLNMADENIKTSGEVFSSILEQHKNDFSSLKNIMAKLSAIDNQSLNESQEVFADIQRMTVEISRDLSSAQSITQEIFSNNQNMGETTKGALELENLAKKLEETISSYKLC